MTNADPGAAGTRTSSPPAGEPGKHLSIDDYAQRDTVFHYSRERRLNRASSDVRALNEGSFGASGLLRNLMSTKANRLLLFAIVFMVISVFLASRFMQEGGERWQYQGLTLGGNFLALTIYPVEETLILAIIKTTPESGEFYTGAVDIAVSPVTPGAAEGEAAQVFTHRIFFNLVESELFQVSLPFEERDFFVVLRTTEEQRNLRLRVGEN